MLANRKEITIVGRKDATTHFMRKLKVSTIQRAFDEALLWPAQVDRPKPVLSQAAKDALSAIDSLMASFPRAQNAQ
jgi:hypothetical protein